MSWAYEMGQPVWHHRRVMDGEREAARRRLRKFATDRARTARAEVDAIVDALRLGVRQVDVMRDVDRSREYVRRIARDAEQDGRLPRQP